MSAPLIALELTKLILQFVGALVIAWLAVWWALGRYKAERTWERRLAAYADAVSAVGEMQLVVGRWFDFMIGARGADEDREADLRDRYQAAKRRLEESIATALLILPKETSALLSELNQKLANMPRASTFEDHLDNQAELITDTLIELIEQGREQLKAN